MSSSSNPFEAMISSNVVPKSVAILPKVSPSCTVYSVKVGLGVDVKAVVMGTSGMRIV